MNHKQLAELLERDAYRDALKSLGRLENVLRTVGKHGNATAVEQCRRRVNRRYVAFRQERVDGGALRD